MLKFQKSVRIIFLMAILVMLKTFIVINLLYLLCLYGFFNRVFSNLKVFNHSYKYCPEKIIKKKTETKYWYFLLVPLSFIVSLVLTRLRHINDLISSGFNSCTINYNKAKKKSTHNFINTGDEKNLHPGGHKFILFD